MSANAQVVGGGPVIGGGGGDLSAYAPLAGADFTGPVSMTSPDVGSGFEFGNGAIDFYTDGTVTFAGATVVHGTLNVDPNALGNKELQVATNVVTVLGDLRVSSQLTSAPTNANDPCVVGTTLDTSAYHYYCYATNTWVRVAMATW